MDAATLWDQISTALGLPEPVANDTVPTALKAAVVALVTLWLGNLVRDRIRRAALARNAYADVVSMLSRAVALVVYAVGGAIVLAIIGVNPTAIATVLAAATIGSSLAMQDVARGWINGLYILIERPYRIGEKVRIGVAEGRVEEIGVRLTRLRADDGERMIVPNSLVFSSVVEKRSAGQFDRQRYTVTGIERSVLEIESAVASALKGTTHLSRRAPVVAITMAGPEGATAHVLVEHDSGHRIDDIVISKLRSEFPEATVTTATASAEA